MNARTALITGGSRGMGKAIAEVFKAKGITVLTPPRSELDLAQPESISQWSSAHGRDHIDILVNNAGINELGSMDSLQDPAWHAMLQINLTAPFQLARTVLPGMIARGWGRIVNIASIWSVVAKERRGGYAATKAGLVGMTRVMAIEAAPHGVLVNALCPGFVATELTRKNNSPFEIAEIAKKIPANRLADPIEIAKTVAWLCSDDNTYLTGQAITVDGGYTAV